MVEEIVATPKHTLEEWTNLAEALKPRGQMVIDGSLTDAASGETFDSINPATGQTIVAVAAGDIEDVDRAVKSARKAFDGREWCDAAPEERKAKLLRLAELINANSDELALIDSLDMGKPVEEAAAVDAPGSAGTFSWYGEAIDKLYDEIAPTGPGNLATITREPLGVVGAVVPWNYPLEIAAWKVAPALAAGNSVVLKPAEQSPLSALRLGELALEAGIPPGVLNVVTGFGETAGKAIGLHPDVDCVAFTGSTEVGKMFLGYSAASNAKPIWLECGGKSPNLVFADVEDLDAAAEMAAFGIFYNQGEVCSANSRLLVERPIRDQLVEKLSKLAEATVVGNPLDPNTKMGPLVEERHADRVMSFIDEGRESANLRTGGERLPAKGTRAFVKPTIFDELDNDAPLAREEIFGPVLAVLDFDREDEALAIANASQYGLAASVWTSSLSRAHRLAHRLRVGTVSVNTVDALSFQTPFGGFGGSGYGRDLSLHALNKYTDLKTTWFKY